MFYKSKHFICLSLFAKSVLMHDLNNQEKMKKTSFDFILAYEAFCRKAVVAYGYRERKVINMAVFTLCHVLKCG